MIFSRIRNNDKIVIGINLPKGKKVIDVSAIFKNGEKLLDFYSNQAIEVKNGFVSLNSEFDVVLLERK